VIPRIEVPDEGAHVILHVDSPIPRARIQKLCEQTIQEGFVIERVVRRGRFGVSGAIRRVFVTSLFRNSGPPTAEVGLHAGFAAVGSDFLVVIGQIFPLTMKAKRQTQRTRVASMSRPNRRLHLSIC
jgi:hypothetical protein